MFECTASIQLLWLTGEGKLLPAAHPLPHHLQSVSIPVTGILLLPSLPPSAPAPAERHSAK